MGGQLRVVANMVDGKLTATKLGQSFFGAGSGSFRAYVPAWKVEGDSIVRHTVVLDEAWLQDLGDWAKRLAALRDAIYTKSPEEAKQLVVTLLREATQQRAKDTIKVLVDDPYALDDVPSRFVSIKVARVEDYSETIWVDPNDITERVRMTIYAPGYNNKARGYIKEVKRRPLRGAVILDDELVRKTGLVPEAWLDTSGCVLYQMQKVVTCRKRHT
jgi:hypothetical protein